MPPLTYRRGTGCGKRGGQDAENRERIRAYEYRGTPQSAYRFDCRGLGLSFACFDQQPDFWNSFHWDRAQFAAITQQGKTNYLDMPAEDYAKARVKHWLLEQEDPPRLSNVMAAQAGPVVDVNGRAGQVSYQYYGQTNYSLVGTLNRATTITWNGLSYSPGQTLRLDITRNEKGRPTSLTYWVDGYTVTYTSYFDPSGEVLQRVVGPRGELVRGYGYDATQTNLLTSVTNALGEVIRYTHETTTFKVTSITRPSGLVTTNFYYTSGPSKGFLQTQVDVGLRTNYFTYTNGNVHIRTNELGRVTTNGWDGLNRLIATHYQDGTYTSNYWNNLDLAGRRDRMGYWTRYVYNNVRQLTFMTNANGTATEYTYCDCGSPEEVKVWNGATALTTHYAYDLAGRLTSVVYPDSYALSYTYDALNRIQNIVDSGNRQAALAYNDFNQLATVSVGPGALLWLRRDYDEYGRVTNSIDRNGVSVTNSFDALGRMLDRRLVGSDGTIVSGLEQFEYSALGLMNYTDALTNITQFGRDAAGRVTAQTNANHETLEFTYNAAGDILTLKDGKNQQTQWKYDHYGRVTNKVDHLGADMFRYQYDPNGRLTNRWQAGGINTAYRYDPIGNLTNIAYPNSGSVALRYDPAGRLTNMTDRVGTTRFGWTGAGQLASEDGPWDADTVSYGYTQRLRTSLALGQPNASPWSQAYGYDDYWRLETLSSPAGAFTSSYGWVWTPYGWTASDLVQSLTHESGATVANTQDGLGRLLSTALSTTSQGTVNSHSYVYNAGHQREQQTFGAGNYVDYTYDDIGQLKTAKGKEPGGTPRAHEQFGYAYDAAWNLNYRTNNGLVQTFGVNSLNELTSISRTGNGVVAGAVVGTGATVTVKDNGNSTQGAAVYGDNTFARANVPFANGDNTFTAVAQDGSGRWATNVSTAWLPTSASLWYDARGNLTNDGRRVFYYDDESQLTSVLVSNTWKSDFVYDGLMRRRVRKEYTWSGGTWLQTNEVRYIYDHRVVLQERFYATQPVTTVPQQTVTYTRGHDLSGSLQEAGGIGGLLARSDSALQQPHAYYHADGNGNVTCLVDTNGVVVAQYSYDPYGGVLAMSGPLADANLYRFSSKEAHPNSGLVYYLYRLYDPALQRWVNRDPAGEGAGISLVAFVYNSPSDLLDAFGLDGEACFGVGGTVGGAGVWGPFVGGQTALGVTTSSQIFIRFQASFMLGMGAYAGVGFIGGVGHCDPIKAGTSWGDAFHAEGNIGYADSVGASVDLNFEEQCVNFPPPRIAGGTGWGAMIAGGWSRTVTIASPPLLGRNQRRPDNGRPVIYRNAPPCKVVGSL